MLAVNKKKSIWEYTKEPGERVKHANAVSVSLRVCLIENMAWRRLASDLAMPSSPQSRGENWYWGWASRVEKQVQSLKNKRMQHQRGKELFALLLLGWDQVTDPVTEDPCCCLQMFVFSFCGKYLKMCLCYVNKRETLLKVQLLFLIPPLEPQSPPEWILFPCNGGYVVSLMVCWADIKPDLFCPQGAAGVSVHQIPPPPLICFFLHLSMGSALICAADEGKRA